MIELVGWSGLVLLTLLISLTSFLWALKSGQFRDQRRARYFPLLDLPPEEPQPGTGDGRGMLWLAALCTALVLGAMVSATLMGIGLI